MLSKEATSTIFKVFGMTRPGVEPRSPEPLANTLPTRPMSWFYQEEKEDDGDANADKNDNDEKENKKERKKNRMINEFF